MTALAPACGDDKPPTTTDSTTAAQTDTSAPTTGDTMLPDCGAAPDVAACKAVTGCLWDEFAGYCLFDCPQIHDRDTCFGTDFCEWFDGSCLQPV